MSWGDYVWGLHSNGVHVECEPPASGRGDGTHERCAKAGAVEDLHGHDHDGPLACGCVSAG
ncbi:hypothetical protein [Actinoplanes sp. URMC 104]|uniref:hypothetical protein n=1 Tax=Actinoplanes sp. URMC 104 TaxID=3423409 RepID=UPI003F1D0596